jgi:serine/threonine-protein kinase
VVPAASHRDEPPPPRRTWLWALLILLLVAAIAAALILVPKLTSDSGPPQVGVPRIIGLTVDDARAALERKGLGLGQETTVRSGGPRNHIVHQDPAPGDTVEEGTSVDYTIVVGPKMVTIPDVTQGTLDEATAQLEGLGLVVDPKADPTSTERKNQVTRTDPVAGNRVPKHSTVTVYYSTGYVEVPSVVGMTQEQATKILEDQHFRVVVSNVPSDTEAGIVTAQDPEAGARRPYGDTVVISVSLGPTTPTTPTESSPTTTPTTPSASAKPELPFET